MKTTGIVRRLDELGRIVIPREFRKTYRINVGDPLEIVALENGDIVISKVDNTGELILLSESACASLSAELGVTAAASSLDRFVACSGDGKSKFAEAPLPPDILKIIKNRGFYNGSTDSDEVKKLSETGFGYVCIAPICNFDDCYGGIFAFSERQISGLDAAAVRLAGKLIGDALQKY